MNNVSLTVDHDVTIVSVFDLQQVAEHTVSCHTLYKVASCRSKRFTILISVLGNKVLEQTDVGLATQLKKFLELIL